MLMNLVIKNQSRQSDDGRLYGGAQRLKPCHLRDKQISLPNHDEG